MAVAIDTSSPATKAGAANATSITSNTFSPPAGSLIVACFGLDGVTSSAQSVSSVTDSLGSHLNWTLWQRDNIAGGSCAGCAEIWMADCASAQTNMTVSGTYAHGTSGAASPDSHLTIIVFTGAAAVAAQTGAVTKRNKTTSGVPTLNVTTTAAGSWVIGEIQNFNGATAPTVPSGQTTTINGHSSQSLNSTDGDAYWTQIQSALTSASGTVVTINDTAPTSFTGHQVVVEVLDGGGAAAVNITPTSAGISEADNAVTAPTLLSPTASAVATATGGTQAFLSLTASGVSAATVPLTARTLLSPTAAGVSAATATVTVPALLTPSASGVSQATATVTAIGVLAPTAAAVTQATATVTIPGITLTNSFEGGTNGTGITPANSGGASGSAFDASTGSGFTYDNTHAAHGALAYEDVQATGGSQGNLAWNTSMGTLTAASDLYIRYYLYITGNPSANEYFCRFATGSSGGSHICGFGLTSGGLAALFDTAANTSPKVVSTGTTVPLNQWIRIEGHCGPLSTTATSMELKVWFSMDSTGTPDIDLTTSTGNTGSTVPGNLGFGTEKPSTGYTSWFDDVGFSTSTWLGPVVSGPAVVPQAAAATQATVTLTAATRLSLASATATAATSPVQATVFLAPAASAASAATLTVSVSGAQRLTPVASAVTAATATVRVPVGLGSLSALVASAATGLVVIPPIFTTPVPDSGETPITTVVVPGSGETLITTTAVPAGSGPLLTTAIPGSGEGGITTTPVPGSGEPPITTTTVP